MAKPDGSGYYVLGTTLQIADPTFSTFTTINGISAAPTVVVPSPDGNNVVVGAGSPYLLSASSYQILASPQIAGNVVGVAFSPDSKYAYILSNQLFQSAVTQVVPSGTIVNTPTLTGAGNPIRLHSSPWSAR